MFAALCVGKIIGVCYQFGKLVLGVLLFQHVGITLCCNLVALPHVEQEKVVVCLRHLVELRIVVGKPA